MDGDGEMPLIRDIRDDLRDAKRIRFSSWAMVCWLATCGVIVWLLDSLDRFDLALPTLNSIAVIGFLAVLKRPFWRRGWFIVTIAVLALLHIPIIVFVPWTTKWIPALLVAVIDSADLVAMLALFAVAKRLADRGH